jgi:hypothetical protein
MYWVADGSNRCTTKSIKTTYPVHPEKIVNVFQGLAQEIGLPDETTRCLITGTNTGCRIGYVEQGATPEQLAEWAGVPKRQHKQVAKVARGFANVAN